MAQIHSDFLTVPTPQSYQPQAHPGKIFRPFPQPTDSATIRPMSPSATLTVIRRILGVLCLFLAWRWGTQDQDPLDVSRLVAAIGAFLVGAVLLWSMVFDLATRPLFALVDLVFFPGGKFSRPVLNLKLPEYYVNEGRYAEALAEYRKIMRHHPDEAEAYERAIWIVQSVMQQPREAARLLRRARRRRLQLDPHIVSLVEQGRRR